MYNYPFSSGFQIVAKEPHPIEFAGNDEIRRLVETFDSFRSFGLAETDACLGEYILNRRLQAVADEFAYGVTMSGKRSSKKSFIQHHGVGSAY
jgi:hypothetical protein